MAVTGVRVKLADGSWTSGGGGSSGPWETVPKTGSVAYNWLTSAVRIPEGVVDTTGWTEFRGIFRNCSYLVEVPWFDMSAATHYNQMFENCASLLEVPALDCSYSGYTTWSAAQAVFRGCTSLRRIQAFGFTRWLDLRDTQLDAEALNEVMRNLAPGIENPSLQIQGTPGAADCDPTIATSKGWTVVS